MPDIVLMRCERRTMSLTVAGCARLWEKAQDRVPKPWEGLAACRTCAIGAKNAGRVGEASFDPASSIEIFCPRCTRLTTRIVNKRLCISCYNRDREALNGRDAKGNRPNLCDAIFDQSLLVTDDNGPRVVRVARVRSTYEAMIRVARDAKGPILIASHAPPLRSPQLSLEFAA